MRRFELKAGRSAKYWEINVVGAKVRVHYGRIGTRGQSNEKKWSDAAVAQEKANAQIGAKTRKGYVEVTLATTPPQRGTKATAARTSPDLDTAPLAAAIAEYGLEEHEREVLALARGSLLVETTWPKEPTRPRLGTSRFGGLPDLSADIAWPERKGIPMQHVAQIACADLPFPAASPLPDAGHLFFFVSTEWAFDDMENKCARVLWASPKSKLQRTRPPEMRYDDEFRGESSVAPIVHPASGPLAWTPFVSVPVPHTKEVKWAPGLAEAYADAWHRGLLDALPPVAAVTKKRSRKTPKRRYDHRLLGYVQEVDWSNQIRRDDVLLLMVASQRPFTWGDADSLHFVIRARDLAARKFDTVRVYNKLG